MRSGTARTPKQPRHFWLLLNTGDGFSVGGKIEFFVGTRKEFEAEENKKNHSGGFSSPLELNTIGV